MRGPDSDLTAGQVRLLDRHRRGLSRLASVLAERAGRPSTEMMFLLAHTCSNVGKLALIGIGRQTVPGVDAVVVPGLARELAPWIERLAVAGPVVDCTHSDEGVPVVVVDENNEMALYRLAPGMAADRIALQNRSVILPV